MLLPAALALLLVTTPDEPITKKNWLTHPRIEAIRAKVKAIDKSAETFGTADADEHSLKPSSSSACDVPNMDMERFAWRDEHQRIRIYKRGGGSEDSSYSAKLYYDEAGKLLFVHATMGAVSDITIEFRIYFENGKEIWRDRQSKGSGGWTFDQTFPDAYLGVDPEKALNAPKDCEPKAVAAIRAKAKLIQSAVDAKKYTHESKPACESDDVQLSRDAWRDEKQRIRQYKTAEGTGDSAFTMTTTYDEKGRILFVFMISGSVNTGRTERRLYFDDGKEIWRDTRNVDGAHSFGNEDDPKTLITAPAAHLAKKYPCP